MGSGDAAVVGGEHITRDQLDTRVHQAKCSYDLQKRTFPKAGSAEYQAIQSQILASLVQRVQLEQKAPSLDVKVTDDQVEKQLDDLKKQYFGGRREEVPGGAEAAVRHRPRGARTISARTCSRTRCSRR